MRSYLFCIILSLLIVSGSLFGQDIIYKTDGTKLNGQVTEITPDEIKYKSAENPTGPTYVIAKENVLLLEYKNGTIEYITKDPKTVIPGKESNEEAETKNGSAVKPKKPDNDILFLNKNTLLLNGAALANADITFLYDREFLDGHLSLTALAGYNFNLHATWPNMFIGRLDNAKKLYDFGLGVNLYPITGNRTQYYMGLLVKYMNYTYKREVQVPQVINGNTFYSYEFQDASSYQVSTLFVNGIQVRLTPTFNYKIFLGLGGFNAYGDLYDKLNSNSSNGNGSTSPGIKTWPKMYIGTCFGYRF